MLIPKNVCVVWIVILGLICVSWSESKLVLVGSLAFATYVFLYDDPSVYPEIPETYLNWIENLKNAESRDERNRSKIQLKDMMQNDDFLKTKSENHELRKFVNAFIEKYAADDDTVVESNIEKHNPNSIAVGYTNGRQKR